MWTNSKNNVRIAMVKWKFFLYIPTPRKMQNRVIKICLQRFIWRIKNNFKGGDAFLKGFKLDKLVGFDKNVRICLNQGFTHATSVWRENYAIQPSPSIPKYAKISIAQPYPDWGLFEPKIYSGLPLYGSSKSMRCLSWIVQKTSFYKSKLSNFSVR